MRFPEQYVRKRPCWWFSLEMSVSPRLQMACKLPLCFYRIISQRVDLLGRVVAHCVLIGLGRLGR
jgi:hypothetical protein